jgi:hypothetical protein
MIHEKFANLVIILLSILPLSLITYGILIYDELRLFGLSGAIFFYGLPSIFLILLFFISKFRTKYKVNTVLFLLSSILSAYMIEGVLILATPSEPRARIDARTYYNAIDRLRQNGKFATLNIVPSSFRGHKKLVSGSQYILPLGGVANATVVYCNNVGEWITYESDEHGFNNPKHLYNEGRVQIMAIGDSFTQGECVKPENNIIGNIRKLYPNTLNLGMTGNGPLTELAYIREYGNTLHPDNVIWFYYEGNDFADLGREKNDEMLLRYLDRKFSQNLFQRKQEVQSLLVRDAEQRIEIMRLKKESDRMKSWKNYMWHFRKTPFFKFITFYHILNRLGIFPVYAGDRENIDLDLFKKILRTAKEEVSLWGGELYFVYICDKYRFSLIGSPNPYRDKVIEMVHSMDISFIDTYGILSSQSSPSSLFEGGHLNEKGYSLIADVTLQGLRD